MPTPSASIGNDLAGLADPRDHLSDRERGVFLGDHLDQRARSGRLVHHVGLVGLDLHELFALLDGIAGRLHPAQDRSLLHRVRQARHDDVGRH